MDERTHRWRRLVTQAALTGGYQSLDQLLRLGFEPHDVAYLTRTGRLDSPARGVYRLPGHRTDWRSKLHLQQTGTPAVPTALSAAMLLELGRPGDLSPGHAEFLSPKRIRPRLPNARIYIADFDDVEIVEIDGLRTTSVDRTLVEIAARHPLADFERCYRAAIRKKLITHAQFAEAVASDERRRGRVALQCALESVGGELVAPSDWSHWAKQRLIDWGLPEPELEVELCDANGRRIGRVDLYWPQFRLVVELDGRAFHLDARSFETDRKRDARLLGIGVAVIRFTWSQYNDGNYFEESVTDAIRAQTQRNDLITS